MIRTLICERRRRQRGGTPSVHLILVPAPTTPIRTRHCRHEVEMHPQSLQTIHRPRLDP
jgi:hypothetical protein